MYILNSEYSEKKKNYILTSEEDVSKLPRYETSGTQGLNLTDDSPCDYGSTALLVTDSITKRYMLMPDNQWKVTNNSIGDLNNGTYIPGDGQNSDIASDEDIKDIIDNIYN